MAGKAAKQRLIPFSSHVRRIAACAGLFTAIALAGCATTSTPHVTRTQLAAPAAPTSSTSDDDDSDRPSIFEHGEASYYASRFANQTTTGGEAYDPHAMTAAHRTLPLGTRVRVVNQDNDRHVTVRINDRGPFVDGRVIDLSGAAASRLKMRHEGVAPVTLQIVSEPE